MWALFFGFVGGFVAWIGTTFVAQPLQRFFQLRPQAAFVVAQYDQRGWIGNPDAKPPDNDWLKERNDAYDKVASELLAFANSNAFVTSALHHKMLGRYRCDVRAAGENLRTLGAAYPGTQSWDQLCRSALSNLRISDWRKGAW
jgi:hypothetical protein